MQCCRSVIFPHAQLDLLFCSQSGNSYGTGYQGVSPQASQQPQAYDASSTGYAADQQQGYNAGQADYNSSQQVLPVQAITCLSCQTFWLHGTTL